MNENDIRLMVEKILSGMTETATTAPEITEAVCNCVEEKTNENITIEDGFVEDITVVDLREQLLVPNPKDKEGYLEMKKYTPSRLGVWRAGPRYKTKTMLRFRADHATAQDSVFNSISDELIEKQGFIPMATVCKDKDEYITRPDLGKKLSDESKTLLLKEIPKNQKVQIVVGDGLSSAAIEANVADILPALKQGLKSYSIDVGPIAFIKNCRVGAMDEIGELTNSDVICLLVGERPGLVTSESMSAYIAYKPTVNMPEARRTVVSNIHKGGSIPVEAGAHIADIIKIILDKKISGVELKL